jgi:hypothetical protein
MIQPTESLKSLSPFPGTLSRELAWPEFKITLINLFLSCHPGRTYGHIDALLSQAEYTPLLRRNIPIEPLLGQVGEEPDSAKEWPQWNGRRQLILTQQSSLQHATAAFYDALDSVCRRLVDPQGQGPFFVDPAAAYQTLNAKFDTLSVDALRSIKASLKTAYRPGEDIMDFILTHTTVHVRVAAAGQAMSEADKVEYLEGALATCGHFASTLDLFKREFPSPAQQTFDRLSADAENYCRNHDLSATTGSSGYAGQAVDLDAREARMIQYFDSAMEAVEASHHALLSRMSTQNNKVGAPPSRDRRTRTAQQTQAPPTGGYQRKPRQYCYSHGLCAHPSSACTSTIQGHDNAATFNDRRGGSDKNC